MLIVVPVNDSKARKELGYENKISVEEGIEELAQDYRERHPQ
jgi:nucleoside-diphosphate-sugar epimerase